MSVPEVFRSLLERLQGTASVKTVYGDPIAAAGKTIIPVAKVGFGFGGGSGAKHQENVPLGKEGIGCGGGVGARPIGVVEVTPETTRFIPIGNGKAIAGAVLFGFLLGMLFARRR